jgi:6-pyruvoyltetrahydropterin/6-carboxytetrahydropterin synthase
MKLAKEFRWEMGHRLPNHKGSCRNVHGHSYKLIVEVEGEPTADGMIIDLQDISKAVKPVLADLDHAFLCSRDDTAMEAFLEQHEMKRVYIEVPSTVENICALFTERILPFVKTYNNVTQLSVRVYETPNSMAELTTVLNG